MLCCTVTPSWWAWARFTDASTLGTVSEAPDANGSQQRTTSRAQSSSFSFTSACSKQSAWRSHHILSPCSRKEYAFLGTAFKKFIKRATSQRSRQESFWYLHRLLLMMAAFQFSQASCSFVNYEVERWITVHRHSEIKHILPTLTKAKPSEEMSHTRKILPPIAMRQAFHGMTTSTTSNHKQ